MKMLLKQKWLVGLIFILGIGLRIIWFGQVPGGIHRDEAYGAWNAFALFHDGIDSSGHSFPVYFEAWAHGQNALNSYLMLPFIALAGGHMNVYIIRLPQLLAAIASLFAVYVLGKHLFSKKIATWALLLLAICPWHIMMSRWGLESNLAPSFLIIGLCFFVLAWEKPAFYVVSALCYGLSLYCYAIIWPIVPIIILLQLLYGSWMGKIKMNPWMAVAAVVLGALAVPLLLFLLVNMEVLPEMNIGIFSIYHMSEFRSNEIAHSLSEIWNNIRNVGYLLKNQNVGRPYDVIMPYGFFYDIGRVFIVIGVLVVLYRSTRAIIRRRFCGEVILAIQLFGGALVGCMITVNMTQINCLYIPLIICEAVGVVAVLDGCRRILSIRLQAKSVQKGIVGLAVVICTIYLWNLCGFQKHYYTDYKELISAHFQEGADDAVRYAYKYAQEENLDISFDAGLKYPNILLAAEITAKEYLATLSYSKFMPAPAFFSKGTVRFFMGLNYDKINSNQIYVAYLYPTDTTHVARFLNHNLHRFSKYWYVATPR